MALENKQIENSKIDNDEISLKELIIKIRDWVSFLKSKWKAILIIGIIGGSIGLTIALFEKPTYKAVLTFAMEDDKGGGGGGGLSGALGLASSFGIDLGGGGGGAFAASNLAELMKSRLLVEKVLLEPIIINGKQTTLLEYYIEINELKKNWMKSPTLEKIKFIPNTNRFSYSIIQDSILQKIYQSLIDPKKLSITQKDKKVTILTIEVTSENEIFAKNFCESLAKETSDFYIETKSKKARINVDVLQKQVDSINNALNAAINSVANEVDNIYNLNPAFNIKGAPSKKKQIDVQANTSILTNLVVQLELAKITLRKETPLIQLIDRPIFPLEKEKFGKFYSIIMGVFVAQLIYILYIIFGIIYRKMIL
jgi:uncharacterized protein involved in exopolysaccharide biosynthesis